MHEFAPIQKLFEPGEAEIHCFACGSTLHLKGEAVCEYCCIEGSQIMSGDHVGLASTVAR
jgi:hypothetical protein